MVCQWCRSCKKNYTQYVQKLNKKCNSFRRNCCGCQLIEALKVYIFGFAMKNVG